MSPERPEARRTVLVVVPPFAGHVGPARAVAARLRAAGHAVAWVGDPDVLGVPDPVCPVRFPAADRPATARGFEAFKSLWTDVLVPFAHACAPAVERAVATLRPDLVLVDQQAVGGALVAERLGVPWATSATTSSEFTDPLAGQPAIARWHRELLGELRERLGDPAAGTDPRFSPLLTLLYTTPELAGPLPVRPASLRFVGPALTPGPVPPRAADAPVLVTTGTANAAVSGPFLDACTEALQGRPAVVIDATCDAVRQQGSVSRIPPVPRLVDLVARSSAVVCHGGHNTVGEALWHGRPVVAAPIRDDQPIVADQVVRAGAGLRVRFARATPDTVRAAVDTVTGDPAYAVAASRVGASFRRAGGAARAAELLLGAVEHSLAPA